MKSLSKRKSLIFSTLCACSLLFSCSKETPEIQPDNAEKTKTEDTKPIPGSTTPTLSDTPDYKAKNMMDSLFHVMEEAALGWKRTVNVEKFNIRAHKTGSGEDYQSLFYKFVESHPYLFHLHSSWIRIQYNPQTDLLNQFEFSYRNSDIDKSSYVRNYIQAVETAYKSTIENGMKPIDVFYSIHNYVGEKTFYQENSQAHDAYGSLVTGKAVCEGYSRALFRLLNPLDIQVICCTSARHMWNRVKLDNSWYNCDVTWDDNESKDRAQNRARFMLTSDSKFYSMDNHDRISHEGDTLTVNNRKFEGSNYFFRNNTYNSNAHFKKGYWYYLDLNKMSINRDALDGKGPQQLHQCKQSYYTHSLYKKVEFGENKIFFIESSDNEFMISSIDYDGKNYKVEKKVTRNELMYDKSINLEPGKKSDRYIDRHVLLGEIALCKYVMMFYNNGKYYKFSNTSECGKIRKLIYNAEQACKNKTTAQYQYFYNELTKCRKSYPSNMPM
ncbi:hypothetical protein [Porphyromonas pogonae]|uniref:transglutaminase domain-containing protein n=1 Tax=Porphyromonas pogonae TaxID=867595 RepID=UPI002E79F4DF|nr:hypothetical protein [Porphyromonas pogonae]